MIQFKESYEGGLTLLMETWLIFNQPLSAYNTKIKLREQEN